MPDIVPLDNLPDALRPKLSPESPEFKAYAAQLEKTRNLAPGTLTAATFKGDDPTALLLAAANDAAVQQPARKPVITIPNNYQPTAPPSVAPRYDPSEGGLPLASWGVTNPSSLALLFQ